MNGSDMSFGGGAASSGPGNDVTEISGNGPPVDGVAGTGAGEAGPLSTYYDVLNKIEYRNSGTLLAPVWVATVAL